MSTSEMLWTKCVSVKQIISNSSTKFAIYWILFLRLLILWWRILIYLLRTSPWVGPGFITTSPDKRIHNFNKHHMRVILMTSPSTNPVSFFIVQNEFNSTFALIKKRVVAVRLVYILLLYFCNLHCHPVFHGPRVFYLRQWVTMYM
jgi:hypothetical protein